MVERGKVARVPVRGLGSTRLIKAQLSLVDREGLGLPLSEIPTGRDGADGGHGLPHGMEEHVRPAPLEAELEKGPRRST